VLQKLAADKQLAVDAYDQGDTKKLASGKLLTADNQIDTTTGTDRLKAVFDNRDNLLFPNQFVNIHLQMEDRPAALVVPSAAVQSGTRGAYVWAANTNENGKMAVKMQLVKVALAQGQLTILDGGVMAGQKVVTDGADRLQNGALVSVTETRPSSSSPSATSTGQASTGSAGAAGGTGATAGGASSAAPQSGARGAASRSGAPAGAGTGHGGRQDGPGGSLGTHNPGDKQ
jgi:multidrug efflux system membrane fusion protein